ncbi:RNA polymerase subunit sigma [Paenibacillus sp. GCM10027627]|uniref:RNA polymerase subunit sigma n=1 Tax=unclassified Paenibacillus TaxID=185978 RepID=UPI00362F7F1D
MNMKILLSSAAILLLLSGCQSKENKVVDSTQAPTATPTASSVAMPTVSSDAIPPAILSIDEYEAYASFQNDLDEQKLKDLEPISVAKMYVLARWDQNHKAAYALYTDKSGHVQWTKEEDEQIPESDRGTKVQIYKQFNGIDQGEFVQTSDFEGYIEFQPTVGEEKAGFQMIKDDDGIWNVSFQPLQ